MHTRDKEINELIGITANLVEAASTLKLGAAPYLLQLAQLEMTRLIYDYSDGNDSAPNTPTPAVRKSRRGRSKK